MKTLVNSLSSHLDRETALETGAVLGGVLLSFSVLFLYM